MIIWRGLGFLVLLITFAVLFATNYVVDAKYGPGYYSAHNWAIGVGLMIAAPIIWLVGLKLKTPPRELLDPNTGQTVLIKRTHSFFFIPMEFWAIILGVIGFALLFIK